MPDYTTNKKYLAPTYVINSDHKDIISFAQKTAGDLKDPVKIAIKIFLSVRDEILYDPYSPFYETDHYKADNILKRGRGYCVQKAVLLCTLGRACQIPSRLSFATVKNHLSTKQLKEFMGSDLFAYHGFTEFYLNGNWVKATPTFNKELCVKHKVDPIEFNGKNDAIFHSYNNEKKLFMEYITYHGSFSDLPLDLVMKGWRDEYGEDRVNSWIKMYKNIKPDLKNNFSKEDPL